MKGHEPKEALDAIKINLDHGLINYDQAKEQAGPHLAALNEAAKKIAVKYGRRHKPITFAGYMR